MIYALSWLPAVLRRAGLEVTEVPGWESRGRAEMGVAVGVICHHTAGPRHGDMPSLQLLVSGRADRPGPLAHLGLGRDGGYHLIAAGRCSHAGAGSWQGVSDGDGRYIGIAAENSGTADDGPWPEVQMQAYRRGVAAILAHLGNPVRFCAGHGEYAQPAGRASGPGFDMDEFRREVSRLMGPAAQPAGEGAWPARRRR